MSKVKIGIIGVGGISESHIQGYLKNENVELYAFCDINEARLAEKGKKYGITRLYTKVEDMVALPELDGVSVCVWNCNHYECTMAALKAGKHVLCEKPLAMNAQQAQQMLDFAKEQGKLLMVGFVLRFSDQVERLKEMAQSGFFGDIYYTKASYLRSNGNPGGWFCDKSRSGGGCVIDLGVHVIDEARYLMGNPKPVSVYATVAKKLDRTPYTKAIGYRSSDADPEGKDKNDVEDFAHATVRFDNGAILVLETSYNLNTPDEPDGSRVEIYGTKSGAITGPLRFFSDRDGHLSKFTFADLAPESFDTIFQKEMAHFVDCIQNGTTCRNTAEDGVMIMKILDAIYASGATGHEVLL